LYTVYVLCSLEVLHLTMACVNGHRMCGPCARELRRRMCHEDMVVCININQLRCPVTHHSLYLRTSPEPLQAV